MRYTNAEDFVSLISHCDFPPSVELPNKEIFSSNRVDYINFNKLDNGQWRLGYFMEDGKKAYLTQKQARMAVVLYFYYRYSRSMFSVEDFEKFESLIGRTLIPSVQRKIKKTIKRKIKEIESKIEEFMRNDDDVIMLQKNAAYLTTEELVEVRANIEAKKENIRRQIAYEEDLSTNTELFKFKKIYNAFFPLNDQNEIEDSFYRNVLRSTNAWRDDSRNFMNSKAFSRIVSFEEEPRKVFKVFDYALFNNGEVHGDYSLLAKLNDEIYEDEKSKSEDYINTTMGRKILMENAAHRFEEMTGATYQDTVVYHKDISFDEDLIENILINFVPDFYQAICATAAVAFFPNKAPVATVIECIAGSNVNPMVNTIYYRNSMSRGIKNIEKMFDFSEEDDDDTRYAKVYQVVNTTNGKRIKLKNLSEEDLDRRTETATEDICLFYKFSCQTLENWDTSRREICTFFDYQVLYERD